MKQKRKVKSLLPKKNFVNGRILTILLVVLSLVLCVWWVSLLTHSAFAEEGEDWQYSVTVNYRYRNRADTVTGVLEHSKTEIYNNGASYSIPSPKHSGYSCSLEQVTGVVNNANVMKYVYYTPEEDINENGIPDDGEWCELQTVCRDEDGRRIDDCWSVLGKDYIRGETYQIPVPGGIVNYVPAMTSVPFEVNNVHSDIVDLPYNKDFNNDGVADKDEYNITMNYTCKLCGRKEYEYCIPEKELLAPKTDPTQTSQDDVSFPWYRIEYDPSEVSPEDDGEEFDITVKLTPERDQNNDCVYDWEQELWEITEFDYTWLDNRVEVLYGMRFLDPSDFTKIVNSIYMSGSSLYISPNPVIVNGSNNTVDTGVYSHILWWENNEVSSNNITLIAWSNNKIHAWNDNASVLWWSGNEVMSWKSGWISAILVGWESNVMGTGHDGNALIWWSNNTIWPIEDPYADADEVSDSIVLWWERNAIGIDSYNVIIWWKKVLVQGKHNIFVYSNIDGWFSPRSHNAFYLNVGGGVWISTGWIEWLSVGGAVSVWRVNINIDDCTGDSLWVIWSYDGCLVWCTKVSFNDGKKWELLDQWNECAKICQNNSGHCLNQDDEVVNVEDSRAQCTEGVVNTDNAELCINDLDSYRGVFFETSLIDSNETCPTTGQNICVYKCKSGYHLTGTAWHEKCYADCPLPRSTEKIKHNEKVTWYNTGNVNCSNDIYVFPRMTEINNKGQPLWNYEKGPIIIWGIAYSNRAKNGTSFESCGNYDHKKTLICNDWTLYLMKADGKADKSTAGVARSYKYESCSLHDYSCDTSVYNLTQQQIKDEKDDLPSNGNWKVDDRKILQWIRWKYEVCIDYNAVPSDPAVKWEQCDESTYHYKFTGCQAGYDLIDGKCIKKCALIGSDGNSHSYDDGAVITWYQITWAKCPDECVGSKLVCNDGVWHSWSKTWPNADEGNWYNYCEWGKKTCDSDVYNVTQTEHNQYISTSIYTGCVSYDVSGNKCTTGDTNYKLINCETGNHTKNNKWCISNTGQDWCHKGYKPDGSDYVVVNVPITWSGSWNTGNWTEPEDCKWACNDGYVTGSDGKSCVLAECWETTNTCKNGVNATWTWSDNSGSWWKCGSKQCHLCNSWYYDVGSWETYPYCDKIQNNSCDNTYPYWCTLTWTANERNSDNITFTWNCPGIPEGVAQGETWCSFSCPAWNSWNFDHKQCEANVCALLPENEGDVKWCFWATWQATTNNMNPTYDSKCEQPVACKYRCSQWYWRYNGVCISTNPICGDSLYSCNASFPVNTGSDESHYYRDCEDQDWSILTTVRCELGKERWVCGKAVEWTCENIVVPDEWWECPNSIHCDSIPKNQPLPDCCLKQMTSPPDCTSYTEESVCNNKTMNIYNRDVNMCSWNNYLTGDGACYCDWVKCGDENCNEDCHDYWYYYDDFFEGRFSDIKPITYWYIDNPFNKYFNVIDPFNAYDALLVSNVPLQCTNDWVLVDTGSITIVKPYNRSSALFWFNSINELNEKLREWSFYSYKYNSWWVEHDRTFTWYCEDDPEGCNRGYSPWDKTVLYIYDYGYGLVRDCDPEHAKVEVEYGKTCSINNMAWPWISTCTNNYDPY